jgi:WD40 repeat protein
LAVAKAKNHDLLHESLNSADIYVASTGEPLHALAGIAVEMRGHNEVTTPRTVSWSPSGKALAIGDGLSLRLWRITSEPKLLLSRKTRGPTLSTAFAPDGRLAASDDDEVVIYR